MYLCTELYETAIEKFLVNANASPEEFFTVMCKYIAIYTIIYSMIIVLLFSNICAIQNTIEIKYLISTINKRSANTA